MANSTTYATVVKGKGETLYRSFLFALLHLVFDIRLQSYDNPLTQFAKYVKLLLID